MTETITTLFKEPAAAKEAVKELEKNDFSEKEIGLLTIDQNKGDFLAIEQGSKSSEHAVAGGATGGVLGALAAGLVSVGTLPAVGLGLVAAGPLVSVFSGIGAGTLVGGLVGSLTGLGVQEHQAKAYEKAVGEGAVLLAVQADSRERAEMAKTILHRYSALKVAA